MRICSFLPSATEMLYALGAGERLVGVSHECDYPPEAQRTPVISRARFDQTALTSAAIEALVSRTLQQGEGLYTIDRDALRQANPQLIVTQALCDVCTVTGQELTAVLRELGLNPEIMELSPTTLSGIFDNLRTIGQAVGLRERAEQVVAELTARVERVVQAVASVAARPRVFCLEWVEPPYASGHWVPELVDLAGGVEVLGWPGQPSRQVRWEEIVVAAPEVLILMPCGFDVARTWQEIAAIQARPEWASLPAVRARQVYLTHASAYFSRPGPRLVDGLEILASVLHPSLLPARYPETVVQPLWRRQRLPSVAAPRPAGQRQVA